MKIGVGLLKLLKRISTYLLPLLVFLIGFSAGITIYKLDLTPIPELRFLKHFFFSPQRLEQLLENDVRVHVKKYASGMPVFSDRDYHDTLGPPELEGLMLIQIPRHFKNKIRIQMSGPVSVYRMITTSNDNWLVDGYDQTELSVNVRGNSSTHTRVVKKSFPPGAIEIYPGGPVSASPILVERSDDDDLPVVIVVLQRTL